MFIELTAASIVGAITSSSLLTSILIAWNTLLTAQRGAEGQTGHSENGISRTWPEKSALLKMVLPHCGSVTSNA